MKSPMFHIKCLSGPVTGWGCSDTQQGGRAVGRAESSAHSILSDGSFCQNDSDSFFTKRAGGTLSRQVLSIPLAHIMRLPVGVHGFFKLFYEKTNPGVKEQILPNSRRGECVRCSGLLHHQQDTPWGCPGAQNWPYVQGLSSFLMPIHGIGEVMQLGRIRA